VLASCLALVALCAGAAPAWARSEGPVYTLQVVEGETTLPEDAIVHTSGSVEPKGSVAVSITRGGTVIARDSGEGYAWMSQIPQVGDVVTLESPIGRTVGSSVYDGLPSMAATVCAGSTNFSGENSPGETVKGSYVTLSLKVEPYGTSVQETGFGRAQVTILSGTTFGGNFLAPLQLGQTVSAIESLETALAGGAVFKYVSENERPVGACPPPPPPPPSPPPPPALAGTLLKLAHITIHSLLKSGWHDQVTINQPGVVTQDLYLENGKLPAYAAANGAHHKKKTPPALLLARGVVTAKSAGTISMLLKLTSKGRGKLKSAKSAKVVLITTLRSASGTKLSLPRHTVSLHR
jgi:hypothetical protein